MYNIFVFVKPKLAQRHENVWEIVAKAVCILTAEIKWSWLVNYAFLSIYSQTKIEQHSLEWRLAVFQKQLDIVAKYLLMSS
jgi:hypothetical protein